MGKSKRKSIRDFLENHSSNPKLHKKVIKQGGVEATRFKYYPNDFRDPSSGSVYGMIYYSDTIPFGKNNLDSALIIASEFGYSANYFIEDGEIDYNKVAWFLWESMIIEWIDYIEE